MWLAHESTYLPESREILLEPREDGGVSCNPHSQSPLERGPGCLQSLDPILLQMLTGAGRFLKKVTGKSQY